VLLEAISVLQKKRGLKPAGPYFTADNCIITAYGFPPQGYRNSAMEATMSERLERSVSATARWRLLRYLN
jgi:hypothetical protein